MKPILELLGLSSHESPAAGDTQTVRKIVRALEEMEPQRARFLAAFAYLLGRIAHADLEISAEETRSMERIVQKFGDLPESQAVLVVEIAKSQNRLVGGTENFQVAREFKSLSSREQRRDLLHCLFAVAAADEEITSVEEEQVRRISEELGLSHREFAEIRSEYNDHRTVMKRLGS